MVAQHKLQDVERRAESYRVDIQVIQKQMEDLHKRALAAEHRVVQLELEGSIHVD
jgi:chaperonin cofactor prefoldin